MRSNRPNAWMRTPNYDDYHTSPAERGDEDERYCDVCGSPVQVEPDGETLLCSDIECEWPGVSTGDD